ncbi:MAG TPA: hypothetical protein VLA46_06315 [Saprospiraceae bacterium]|nr:hypothetical protein [Saprospiraceae bacterium]
MSRNQILVRNIKHLTDARYFAAMGVDWMSMELNSDPTSFMRWHTLKDWVEGVKLAAEIDAADEMLLSKTIIDAKPEGIVLSHLIDLEGISDAELFFDTQYVSLEKCPNHSFSIIHYDEIDAVQILDLDPSATFVQHDWTVDELDQLLMTGYKGGICLTGGDEDATGMRDYELMDDLFERLIGL